MSQKGVAAEGQTAEGEADTAPPHAAAAPSLVAKALSHPYEKTKCQPLINIVNWHRYTELQEVSVRLVAQHILHAQLKSASLLSRRLPRGFSE